MHYTYKPTGVCSKQIDFDIIGDIITNISFSGGCNGNLKAIVEHKDADEDTLKIDEVNSGGYWFDCKMLLSVLGSIKSDNKAGEYYLPDAIKLLLQNGKTVGAYTAECSDAVLGANDPAQLEELNQIALKKGYSC